MWCKCKYSYSTLGGIEEESSRQIPRKKALENISHIQTDV